MRHTVIGRRVFVIADRLRRASFVPYVVAVLCAVISVVARLALDPVWGPKLPLFTFFPAVALSAWFGGFRPGLITTTLCALAAAYFWFPPRNSPWVRESADVIALGLFVSIGILL